MIMVDDSEVKIPVHLEIPEITHHEGLLYHGAKKPFEFKSDYQFNDPTLDGSFTLGTGLYLTDMPTDAANYSEVRQHPFEKHIVYSVYAPDCRFLDFRSQSGGNVPVPKDILLQWIDYFGKDLEREKEEKPDIPEYVEIPAVKPDSMRTNRKYNFEFMMRTNKENYFKYLKEITNRDTVDLRVMFGTGPTGKTESGYTMADAPMWSNLIREFFVDKLGYDGIIYIEGGEGKKGKDHASFVVYNLNNVYFSKDFLPKATLDKLLNTQTY